jgi:hypothetical protein
VDIALLFGSLRRGYRVSTKSWELHDQPTVATVSPQMPEACPRLQADNALQAAPAREKRSAMFRGNAISWHELSQSNPLRSDSAIDDAGMAVAASVS